MFTEINEKTSTLAELSKRYEILPNRELNESLNNFSKSLDNFQELIDNKADGLRREREVKEELEKKYPESEGYEIVSEAYLRDSEGNIVHDPETGQGRRIDFVVVKDGQVIDSIEVTSLTADKTGQMAKEERVRAAGGNYIRTSDGSLVKYPDDLYTTIERRK